VVPAPKPLSQKAYFPALTGLRFVLALWVMLHHLVGKNMMLGAWAESLSPAAQSLARGGYLAVQTFFLLSGFVMARNYANSGWNREDLVKYGAARLARIYPVYLLSLMVVAPFIWATMRKPGHPAAHKATLLADYVFVLQGWTGNLGVGWNTPAWSLSCEFFFYLLFPMVFPLMRNVGRRVVAAIMVACIVVPILLAHAHVPWSWKPIHHFADFVAGIVAARAYEFLSPRMRDKGYWLYLPATAAGLLLVVYPGIMEGTYGDLNTGLRPLNVLALTGLALGGGTLARLLSTRAADYLGKVSYSMYILHVPMLWWYGGWSMTASVFGLFYLPRGVAAVVYFLLVVAAGAISFQWVEMPANRWARGYVSSRLAARRPLAVAQAA
jgi:peptidoglycan/LPS O-acetylase OafA/YrhL